MKKILWIMLCLLLVSCGQSDEELLGINASKQEIQEENIIETATGEVMIQENVWDEVQSVQKPIANNKELIMKNHNVFLREPWKEDIVLTTRAKGIKECSQTSFSWGFYTYEILFSAWDFGLVERKYDSCEWFWTYSYYTINLNNQANSDTEMTEITEYFSGIDRGYFMWSFEIEINDSILRIKIWDDTSTWFAWVVKSENDVNRWNISESEAIKEWFIFEWKKWVKEINLVEVIPNIEDFLNNNSISKLPKEYQHDALLSEWYKVNKLWDITEYYRETPLWGSIIDYETIYIKYEKILDIKAHYSDWGAMSWDILYIKVWDGVTKETIDLPYYGDYFPIQPIFKKSDIKMMVDNELNKISMVFKERDINEVIWTRK